MSEIQLPDGLRPRREEEQSVFEHDRAGQARPGGPGAPSFRGAVILRRKSVPRKGGETMHVKTSVKAGDDNIVWGN